LPKKKLGEHLIESHLIKEPQLEEALRLQLKTNELLGKILQKLGFVSEEQVARALAEQLAMPFAAIEELDACRENIKTFPLELALKRKIFPLGEEGGRLRLAMANPFDWQTVDEIAFTTGHKIVPVLATESAIMSVLDRHCGSSRGLDGAPSGLDPGGAIEPLDIRTLRSSDSVSADRALGPNELAGLLAGALAKIREGLADIEEALSRIPPRAD
jgi:hypothetical protein